MQIWKKEIMAPKRRGSANTKASPSLEETSNPETLQMNQLAKMIQGYEEKNNATTEMMIEMKKMFEEKCELWRWRTIF